MRICVCLRMRRVGLLRRGEGRGDGGRWVLCTRHFGGVWERKNYSLGNVDGIYTLGSVLLYVGFMRIEYHSYYGMGFVWWRR
jgi:hypothetical protein